MTRRTLLCCLGTYAMIAVLGVPVGWALARREAPPAAVSARGPVSLGPVVLVASTSSTAKEPADAAAHTFTMSGGVTGLTPGRRLTLPVLVTNPNSQSIKVLTLTVTAKDATSACRTAGNLSVGGYDSGAAGAAVYIVPGRGSAVVPLPIELVNAPDRNQNACKGVAFGLSYVGTAMQWGN